MSPTMKDLGIDRLTTQQRVDLAMEIWESLEERPAPTLTASRLDELHRRNAELDADPQAAITWEQIRAAAESQT